MTEWPGIVLRYFDCRGRAQFLRNYLTYRNIPFRDERVPLSADFSAWTAIRDDRSISGPFKRLPVLHWGDELVPEAPVIAAFLHERSGDEAALSAEDNLRHRILLSSLYTDLMQPVGILIWSDLMFPGTDPGTVAGQILGRVELYVSLLSQTLADWRWLEAAADRPVLVADCLLWEGINAARLVFGDRLTWPPSAALARWYETSAGAPVFARLLADAPCQLTGRPGEADALALIHTRLGQTAA
jgi:hypothetical protein